MKNIIVDKNGKVEFNYPTSGTSLKDCLNIRFSQLVATFEEPNGSGDDYKVDAEWVIKTPAGIATIYNYKDGKNYLGRKGTKVEDITDWHIGGKTKEVVKWIKLALNLK